MKNRFSGVRSSNTEKNILINNNFIIANVLNINTIFIGMMIVVVDYGIGNISSIINMVKKAGGQAVYTSSENEILQADKLILVGVGSFDTGMKNINESGLKPILDQKVLVDKTPVLGICLGMQLMTKGSEEGSLPGLGWIDGCTYKFPIVSKLFAL